MASERKSFIIHKDSLEILDQLSDEQAGKLFKAIFQYQKTGDFEQFDQFTKIILTPFISQFRRDEDKWLNVVERNKANIAKRWNTKNTTGKTGIPKDTKNTDSDSKSKSVSDSDSKSDIKEISSLREAEKNQLEKDFEEFWESYMPIVTNDGKKVDKGSKKLAKISYGKARKDHDAETIYNGTAQYLADCYRNNRLSCQVSVCLNQERFLNDFNAPTLQVKTTEKHV